MGGDTGAESGEKWLWFLDGGRRDENKMRCCLLILISAISLVLVFVLDRWMYLYEPPLLTVTLTPFCSLGSLRKCAFNESTFDQSLGQSAGLDHRHSQGQSLVDGLVDVGVKFKEHFHGKVRVKS